MNGMAKALGLGDGRWAMRLLLVFVWVLVPLLGQGVVFAEEGVVSPSAPQEASDVVPAAGHHKTFFLQSEDGAYKLSTQARVQTRLTFEQEDQGDDTSAHSTAFSLPRVRLKFKGNALTKAIKYRLQFDFGKGNAVLKDAYTDIVLLPGAVHIKVGQYKRPFSRQQLVSSGKLELVDRAITDKAFGAGRDIGVMVHNGHEVFEYAVGVFNGTGDKAHFLGTTEVDLTTGVGDVSGTFTNVPENLHPAFVAQVGYNHGGIKGYSEADLEGGGLRFAIGAAAYYELDVDEDDETSLRGVGDIVVKWNGLSVTGAGFYRQDDSGGAATSLLGAHAQVGYVIAEQVQPAVRVALLEVEDGASVREVGGAFSVYFFGHTLKWQTDGLAITTDVDGGEATTDVMVRSQLQLAF